MSKRLVVHLTTDEPEKTATALTVAMTAAAGGATVDLWLSGPATMFAVVDREPQLDLELARTRGRRWLWSHRCPCAASARHGGG